MTYPAPAAPAAPAHPGTGGAGQAPQAPVMTPWPFPVGVFDQEVQSSYDQTVTATTATVQFPDVQIEPDGWARGWWFDFDMKVSANTATVVFAADAPFNAIDTVLLKGTNVPQTFGPFGGYDWENINKFGAYQPIGDPRNDQTYSTTTGTVATGGNAHWTLYLPLEVSVHDALGDLQNQSDNSVYRVAVTHAALATIYTTAPSGTVTTELKVTQDSYSEPVAALALSGRPIMDGPPLPGTRQCWQQESDGSVPGASYTTKITNGIGFAYRMILLKFLRAGTSRANGESDFPDPLELWLGGTRIKRYHQNIWKTKTGRLYALISTTADAANGPENGVRVIPFNRDVGLEPGNEARRKYLRTQDGNVFKTVGTWGHAGTLYTTSNYVIPRGGPANNANIVA